jgi:DNA-binding response OmpR family regulator
LVVEDHPDIVDLLVTGLEAYGYSVKSAPTRDDALSVLKDDVPHVILMDYRMPGLSAEQFIENVRQRNTQTQVVLMSAEPQVRDMADELGLEHTLAKPFDYDVLLKTVSDASGMYASPIPSDSTPPTAGCA